MSVSLRKTPDYVANIEGVLSMATPAEFEAGALWYPTARAIALECGDALKGAGVLAVLSPRCPWNRNVVLARRAFNGTLTDGYLSRGINAANAIMGGANVDDYVKGQKIRAFMHSIVDANHPIAVVDVHAYNIANGERTLKGSPGVVEYREIASACATVAAMHGLKVSTVQAVTWLAWRRMIADGVIPVRVTSTADGLRYAYARTSQAAI